MKIGKHPSKGYLRIQFRFIAFAMAFSALFLLGFMSHAQVTISNFSPMSGCGGATPVVITGTNFTGATVVTFGGINAQSYVVNGPTQITAVPALGNTGTISVTSPLGTGSSAGVFTINIPPAVPNPVSATPSTICQGTTSQLNATAALNDVMNWYTVPLGGVAIGSSLSGVNFPVTPAVTTTYYAENNGVGVGFAQTYSFTGALQTFTVPAGVTSMTIEAWGAEGSSSLCVGNGGGTGSKGGYAKGDFTVVPGQVLNIYVGGQAGYNGGGLADCCPAAGCQGGNGGGASDVRIGGIALVDRKIVAGAGGGGGGGDLSYAGGNGGEGGNLIAAAGTNSFGCGALNGGGGGGATQVAGGDAGCGGQAPANCMFNGYAGALGIGGNGNSTDWKGGGGGGGGYYGGGGGGSYCANGGGGGGSSYIDVAAANIIHTPGIRQGDGQVIITWGGAASCPSVRVPITVTVNPAPIVAASATPDSICIGGSSVLTGSGAVSYLWNPGALVGSPTVTPAVTTTYTVIGTNAGGCTATSLTTITVNNIPNVTAMASPAIICAGASSVLTGSGAVTYSWNPGGLLGSPTVTPAVTTIYTVTGSVGAGCSATSIVVVTVNAAPAVTASASPISICVGGTSVLTGGGAATYLWNPGGLVGSPTVSPVATTIYTVTGTVAGGCSATSVVTITVGLGLTVIASASPSAICVGASSVLAGSGAVTYNWNPGGLAGSPTVTPSVTTTYTVTGSNGAGCTGTSIVAVTVVNLNPVILNAGGVLSVLNGPYTTYQWYRNGSQIAGAINATYSVVQNGTYEVEVTLNNCTKRSASMILNGVGLIEMNLTTYSISPNPTTDKITIKGMVPASVKILNMQGQVIKELINTSEVSLSNLSNGIYFIRLFDEKGLQLFNQKVTKQ